MLTTGEVLAERYEITGTLSRGGPEVVYEAKDKRRKTLVTIREVDFVDEAMRQALESEARLLIALRHPTLPFVLDQFTEGQRHYLVTEFVGEDSLADRLSRSDGLLPVDEVLEWAWQILDALEYLHGRPQPILHGRLKPSNIHVKDGQVFLLGLHSAPQDGGHGAAHAAIAYAQPQARGFVSLEQIRGLATTPASDIYSLGTTLYALLTNVAPDDALQRAISESDPLEPIESRRPGLDANVTQAVMAALALDSKRRPQSAREMRDLLFEEAEKRDAAQPERRYARALTAAGLLASIVLVGTVWHFYPPSCDQIPSFVSQRVRLKCLPLRPAPPPAEARRPPEERAVDPRALATEAAERLQRRDYQGAVQAADVAIAADPNYAYAYAVKGDALWDTRYEAAEYEMPQFAHMQDVEDCAKKILELVKVPRTPEEHAALAWAHIAQKKYTAAFNHADKAIGLKRDLVMAYILRATAVFDDPAAKPGEPRYQRAVDDLLLVSQLKPEYPQARYLLSKLFVSHDILPYAEKEVNEAIRLYPQAKSFTWLGDIFMRYGDKEPKKSAKAAEQYSKAAEQYNKALEQNRNFVPAYRKLAQLHYDQERWNDALAVLGRGLQIRKDDASLHELSGRTHVALNNKDKALAAFDRAAQLDPDNHQIYARRANLRATMQDAPGALADSNKAIEIRVKEKATHPLTPADAALYEIRANALYQMGDVEAAEEDERRAQQLRGR